MIAADLYDLMYGRCDRDGRLGLVCVSMAGDLPPAVESSQVRRNLSTPEMYTPEMCEEPILHSIWGLTGPGARSQRDRDVGLVVDP